MIWMAGTDKLCNYIDQPWLDFTGRSIEAELGNGWAEMMHPEDFQKCLNTYQAAFDRHDASEIAVSPAATRRRIPLAPRYRRAKTWFGRLFCWLHRILNGRH